MRNVIILCTVAVMLTGVAWAKYEVKPELKNAVLLLEDFEDFNPDTWNVGSNVNRRYGESYYGERRPSPEIRGVAGGPDRLTELHRKIRSRYREIFYEPKKNGVRADQKSSVQRLNEKQSIKFQNQLVEEFNKKYDKEYQGAQRELYAWDNDTYQWYGGKVLTALSGAPNYMKPYKATSVMGVKLYYYSKGFTHVSLYPNRGEGLLIKGLTKEISVWVLGRSYPHKLEVEVEDYQGITHRFPFTWENPLYKMKDDAEEKQRLRNIEEDEARAIASIDRMIKRAETADNDQETTDLKEEKERIKAHFAKKKRLDPTLNFKGWKKLTAFIPRNEYIERFFIPVNKKLPGHSKHIGQRWAKNPDGTFKKRQIIRSVSQKRSMGGEVRPIKISRIILRQNPISLVGIYYIYFDHLTAVSDINKLIYDGGDIKDHW
jgi:hypothetical protein